MRNLKDLHLRKWRILAVVTLVSFITNVDSTIVIIGLAKLMEGLNITVVTGLWTITSYIIASTVFLLPAGRWADMIGTKRIFLWGLAIFTVATVLCGIASSGFTIIIFRSIQGIGAAFALATATPIIMSTFPKKELGLAIGINSTSWVVGAIVGPVAGGALINQFGWRSIFFVTVPFALIGWIAAWFILEDKSASIKSNTDWKGIFTFGLGLISLMVALSEGQLWGWKSSLILALFIATIVLWITFIITELREENPLFNFSLLSHIQYTAGLGITLNYCIGYFGITLLLTIYLQGALHLNPFQSGLLLIPLSAPQLVMGPLGGKMADHFGSLRPLLLGIVFLVGGLLMLGKLGIQLSVMAVVIPLIIISVANGLAWPALAKAVLSAAPQEQAGAASGMFYTIYNVGRALSQAFVLMVVEFGVSSDIVSQALIGKSKVQNQNIVGSLVNSIDLGFSTLIIFFGIAILLVLFLQYRYRKNNVKDNSLKEGCVQIYE
jgi:EmrB/QacA subfamily drug resistance transporter